MSVEPDSQLAPQAKDKARPHFWSAASQGANKQHVAFASKPMVKSWRNNRIANELQGPAGLGQAAAARA